MEVSSDAVCQGNGAYLEAHAPAALLAKIYLSMVSFYFLSRGRSRTRYTESWERVIIAGNAVVSPRFPLPRGRLR